MPEPLQVRRWPRFHLSTGIILLFAAAGVLWLNMQRRFELDPSKQPYFVHFGSIHRGWPFDAISYPGGLWSAADYVERDSAASKKMLTWKAESDEVFALPGQGVVQQMGDATIILSGLLGNVLVALILLILLGMLVERLSPLLPLVTEP